MTQADYVPFPVPADLVPAVSQILYGPNGLRPAGALEQEEPALTDAQRDEILTRIYIESEPTFRRLLVLLADRDDPTEPIPATALTERMGWQTRRSLAGALGAFGRRSKHRYGWFDPFVRSWEPRELTNAFAMERDVAAFVTHLHAQQRLPVD